MEKNALEAKAISAFENLTSARNALFTAAEITIMEKYLLEGQKADAITSGVIDGKNAEIRESQLREHLQDQFLKLASAENAERKSRLDFDLANIEADAVKILLRIAEL